MPEIDRLDTPPARMVPTAAFSGRHSVLKGFAVIKSFAGRRTKRWVQAAPMAAAAAALLWLTPCDPAQAQGAVRQTFEDWQLHDGASIGGQFIA